MLRFNRFLRAFLVVIAGLYLLVAVVDKALEGLSHASTQSTFVIYNEMGQPIMAYSGDISGGRALGKPIYFLHRT